MWHERRRIPHLNPTHPKAMSFLNTNSFRDRQAAAQQARKAMADKFLARPKYDPHDPAVAEREARRKAILEARVAREAERAKRKAEQEADEARRRADEEARRQEDQRLAALRSAEEEAVARAEQERVEFEKKLERDARYAARKARKQKKKTVAERWG